MFSSVVHSLAIDEDGNLYAWGDNSSGQLGNNSKESILIPTKIMEGTKFKEVQAGASYSMAIDEDGNLYTWGDNSKGQLGNGTTTNSMVPMKIKEGKKFKGIYCSRYSSKAIDEDDCLWAWGENGYTFGDGTSEDSSYQSK